MVGQVVGGKVLRRISDLEDLDGPSAAPASKPAIVQQSARMYMPALPVAGRPIGGSFVSGLYGGGFPGYPAPVGLGYSTTIAPTFRAPVGVTGPSVISAPTYGVSRPLVTSSPIYGGIYRR